MGIYIQQSDIQAAMSSDDYSRLFDRNGSGIAAEILAFTNLCIAFAESRINSVIQGRLTTPLPAPIDVFVQGLAIDLACMRAARYHPAYVGDDKSPYAIQAKEAMATLKDLVRDRDARTVTSNAGIAQPRARVDNTTQSDGVTPTNPFTRAADGTDTSGF